VEQRRQGRAGYGSWPAAGRLLHLPHSSESSMAGRDQLGSVCFLTLPSASIVFCATGPVN
jgi:hypothetical protein